MDVDEPPSFHHTSTRPSMVENKFHSGAKRFHILFRQRGRYLLRNRCQFVLNVFFPLLSVLLVVGLSAAAKQIKLPDMGSPDDTYKNVSAMTSNCESLIAYYPNESSTKSSVDNARNAWLKPCATRGFKGESEAATWIDNEARERVIVDLSNLNRNEYRILRTNGTSETAMIQAQIFVEFMIIRRVEPEINTTEVVTSWLPTKDCAGKSNGFSAMIMNFMLPFIVCLAFYFAPNALNAQLVMEKRTRMREYLQIMGISRFQQLLSWLLLYALLILPMSIVASLLLRYVSGIYHYSNPGVFVLMFVFYGIAQLSVGYLFGCIVRHSPQLVFFGYTVFSFLFSSSFSVVETLNGPFILMATHSLALLSPFHAMNLLLNYISAWESVKFGAQFSVSFRTPFYSDEFGGFGLCFIYLTANTILNVIAGWYLQNVFPGEYGVKLPFYFPFTKSYWFNKDGEESELKTTVSRTSSIGNGVELRNLTKQYGDFTAVSDLSVSFQPGKITALLGENGAGKSTTMNMIVGVLNPTSGQIFVNGVCLQGQFNIGELGIGYVPQYDILYPSLTVEDHIDFYARLCPGLPQVNRKTAEDLLHALGIAETLKIKALCLSGGQKRKFSLVCALLSNPACLILDEPTSGVDPFSRRQIWDLVMRARSRGTTIILSTHYLDEAEVLADYVAIVGIGKLLCQGTCVELKNEYSLGYKLSVTVADAGAKDSVIESVQSRLPSATLHRQSDTDVVFSIPTIEAQTKHLVECLDTLEHKGDNLGVMDFGVAEPTMDEVFLTASKRVATKDTCRSEAALRNNRIAELAITKALGRKLWLEQSKGLVQKRLIHFYRSKSDMILQFVVPILLTILLIGSTEVQKRQGADEPLFIYDSGGIENMFYVYNGSAEQVGSFAQTATETGLGPICDGRRDGRCVGKTGKAEKFIHQTGQVNETCTCGETCESQILKDAEVLNTADGSQLIWLTEPDNNTIIALQDTRNVNVNGGIDLMEVKGKTVKSTESQAPNVINAMNNVLFRLKRNEKESIYGYRGQSKINLGEDSQFELAMNGMKAVWFAAFIFGYLLLASANFLIMEKASGLRRFQFCSGISRINYVLSNYLCSVLFIFLSIIPVVLLFLAIGVLRDVVPKLLVLFVMYCFAAAAYIQALSLLFRRLGCLIIYMTIEIFVFIFISTMVVFMSQQKQLCLAAGVVEDEWCEGIFGATISSMANVGSWIVSLLPLVGVLCGTTTGLFLPLFSSNPKFGDVDIFNIHLLGKYPLMLFVSTLFWLGISILLTRWADRDGIKAVDKGEEGGTVGHNVDDDVMQEHALADNPESAQRFPVVARSLVKHFRRLTAVRNVSFVVPKSHCFGLLGVNGAGKTTTFRMIAREIKQNSGSAMVMGYDTVAEPDAVGKCIGYCPQDNILFEKLTVLENLNIFARFNGLDQPSKDALIPFFVDTLGLREYENKQAGGLSGGNKRKLQMAIAMLDFRPVILLDEPTSGMDPGARMRTWDVIRLATEARQCSVILTSHSMQECEELCDRLLIMVMGQVQCIGPVQYLKNKLGNKYTIKLRFPPLDQATSDKVHEHLLTQFPGILLVEQHETQLEFEIQREDLESVAKLFDVVLDLRQQPMFTVSSFAISQASLEHVFVKYAENLEMSRMYVQDRMSGVYGQQVQNHEEGYGQQVQNHEEGYAQQVQNHEEIPKGVAYRVTSSGNEEIVFNPDGTDNLV